MTKILKTILSLAIVAVIILPTSVFAIGEEDGEDIGDDSEWCQSADLDDPEIETVTVHFDTDGGTEIPDAVIPKHCSLREAGKEPISPTKNEHTFYGWFFNDGFTDKYYIGYVPEENTTLYAQFVSDANVISNVEIDVQSPVAGNEVTVTVETDQGAVIEMQEPIPQVGADEVNYHVGYAGWFTGDDELFEGSFVEGEEYFARIELGADEGYKFSPTLIATVNGTPIEAELNEWSNGDWATVTASLIAVEGQLYTVEDGEGNSVSFYGEADEERKYKLEIEQIRFDLSEEEIEEMDEEYREVYEAGKAAILGIVGDQGDTLAYLDIHVCDISGEYEYCISDGPFTIKFKLSDDMKGYDNYKVMYTDITVTEEGEIEVVDFGEPITCDLDGDYIVCVLPHLSGYTLIGSDDASAPDTGVMTNPHEAASESLILAIILATAFVSAGVFLIVSDFRRR